MLLLLASTPALADGCFLKQHGFPVPPAIPGQRALVVHRDGVEHLVVESTLDAEGQTFGWILPVPARPTDLAAVSPGALDTLDLATRARVRSDDSFGLLIFLAGTILVLAAAVRRTRADEGKGITIGRRVAELAVVLGVLCVLAALAIPNLLASKLGMPAVTVPGVEAVEARRVGGYEVAVLEARDGAALDAWLGANGLAGLPPTGRPIADDYAARGWFFVAARLAREGSGTLTPHPLSVTFPADRPVYPMRLTALAGGTTELRVHVAAEGTATCAPLAVGFSGRFEEGRGRVTGAMSAPARPMLLHGPAWQGRGIAHPALRALLWDGCVITRLEGPVAAAAMDRDFIFEVGEEAPFLRVLHTPADAWRAGFQGVVWWWALAMLVLMALPDRWLPSLGMRGAPFLRWCLLLAVGAVAGAAGIRGGLETIPEEGVLGGRDVYRLGGIGVRALRETGGWEGRPLAEARALLEARFRAEALLNPFTGRPVRWGDSPGEVELIEDARGPVLRIWSLEGAPVERVWAVERVAAMVRRSVGEESDAEARRRLFPDGVLEGDARNPFTGGPIREGRGPGEAELLRDEGNRRVLRLWFREGRHEDIYGT